MPIFDRPVDPENDIIAMISLAYGEDAANAGFEMG
jgi:hypothetical protein